MKKMLSFRRRQKLSVIMCFINDILVNDSNEIEI